jgi:hypothetical protein
MLHEFIHDAVEQLSQHHLLPPPFPPAAVISANVPRQTSLSPSPLVIKTAHDPVVPLSPASRPLPPNVFFCCSFERKTTPSKFMIDLFMFFKNLILNNF